MAAEFELLQQQHIIALVTEPTIIPKKNSSICVCVCVCLCVCV